MNDDEQRFWDAAFIAAMGVWPMKGVATNGTSLASWSASIANDALHERRTCQQVTTLDRPVNGTTNAPDLSRFSGGLSEAELVALAALATVDAEDCRAANMDRESRGEAMAYSEVQSEAADVIRAEMKRRGILKN